MVGGVGICGSACGNVSEDLLIGVVGFMCGCRGWEIIDCACGADGRGCHGLAWKL